MRLGIMQPYIFPYIGYYQLIDAVDRFVVYDDVNFINKGWINRNNLLVNNKSFLFAIPLKEASQNRHINEIELIDDDKWKKKFLKTIELSYKRAPYFEEIFIMVKNVIDSDVTHIAHLAIESLKSVVNYLEIKTEFVNSSSIYGNQELKGQMRILDICKKERVDQYLNLVGGMGIYSRQMFADSSVNLNFIKPILIPYRQFIDEFVPSLSIIDILMFNSKENIQNMLASYDLL